MSLWTTLLQPMLAFTAGLALVLLLRRGVRHLFGAGTAYALWILPLATTLGSLLPAWTASPLQSLPAVQAWHGAVRDTAAAMQIGDAWTMVWIALWIAGAALTCTRLAIAHIRLHRALQPAPLAFQGELERLGACARIESVRLHAAGPAVVWSGRNLVLLPADFLTRFEPAQRALVVAHESTHLRHGDALWNLLFEVLMAALWFHPLLWLARARFRMDQELACDASMLQRHPEASCAYARTLLRGAGYAGTPVLATWLDEPQLKERLTMIRDLATRKPLRRMALPALAMLLAGGLASVQAMTAPKAPAATKHGPTIRDQAPLKYPAHALKNHLQGTVVLRLKVGSDGQVLKVQPLPGKADASLVTSAIAAARQWRFNPATDAKGVPTAAWIKVPVRFAMNPPHAGK